MIALLRHSARNTEDITAALRQQLTGTKRRIHDLSPGQEQGHLAAVIRELEQIGIQVAALYATIINEHRWLTPGDVTFCEQLGELEEHLSAARIGNGCEASPAIVQHQLNQAHVWASAALASLSEAQGRKETN